MKLEHLLLGVLLQHPSTGYDIKKYLDTSGRFLRSNTQMSQVYRSLGRMEADGWVIHTVQPRPTAAVDTKTYSVTAEGATVFLDWLKGPYDPPSRMTDPEFGARLSFAGFFTPEELIVLLDTEITVREEQIVRYRHRDRRLPRDPVVPFDFALADLVGELAHQWGSEAMDQHVAQCRLLRDKLLDGAPSTGGAATNRRRLLL
jgi:PadR family transcriptional regulator, regulatory protein AphA